MSEGLLKVAMIAEFWHRGQLRHGGDTELSHLLEVGMILSMFHAPGEVVCAGILHDILEDTKCPPAWLKHEVGDVIFGMVFECTDAFTAVAFPNDNYETRKTWERGRIAGLTRDAKAIKLADLISNARSMVKNKLPFARKFLDHKILLLPHLEDSYRHLYEYAVKVLEESEHGLVQNNLELKPHPSA